MCDGATGTREPTSRGAGGSCPAVGRLAAMLGEDRRPNASAAVPLGDLPRKDSPEHAHAREEKVEGQRFDL